MASRNLIDVYLRTIQAFNEDDVQTLVQRVAPDAKYVFHGQHLVSGVYYGIDGRDGIVRTGRCPSQRSGGDGVGSVPGSKERAEF